VGPAAAGGIADARLLRELQGAPAGQAESSPAGLPILGVYLLVAIALVTAGLTIRRTKR
jgi:hypothetical protein